MVEAEHKDRGDSEPVPCIFFTRLPTRDGKRQGHG